MVVLMTWVIRSFVRHARCIRATPIIRTGGPQTALSRSYHASTIARQELATQQIAGDEQAASNDSAEQTFAAVEPSTSPSLSQSRRVRETTVSHSLATLDPAKLSVSDYVDLSSRTCELQLFGRSLNINYLGPRVKDRSFFPHGTHGFFYLARGRGVPAIASELRFRITDSPNPGCFELGRDLILPYGLPWSVPLAGMLRWRSWRTVVWKLLNDALIPYKIKKTYEEFLEPLEEQKDNIGRVLYSYNQPFVYHFGDKWPGSLLLLGVDSPSRLVMNTVFDAGRLVESNSLTNEEGHKLELRLPVQGSVVLCFVKTNDRRAALRCLRVITPLKYNHNPIKPTETGDAKGTTEQSVPAKHGYLKIAPGELLRVKGKIVTIPLKTTAFLGCNPPVNQPTEVDTPASQDVKPE